LRPEAKKAIRKCAKAHIKTVMITGDHKLTACAIAKQAGILSGNLISMTGDELTKITDSQLDDVIEKVAVFARVTPDHKLRIVKAFKRRGHIVAMTGDGVNDAPAIKEADIGVSMGITGTDVTKQAADVILLDDNFSTLVGAVEQGRTIYSNIRKFVRYLISCNIGEVVTMFVSIIMGLPIILLPTQILLVNLVTDGLPAIALGLEPPDDNIMTKTPRKSKDSFFNDGLMGNIVIRGILIGMFTIASFVIMLQLSGDLHISRTGALFTLVVSQLIHVFECKSEDRGLFSIDYKNNIFLVISVIISLACLLAAIYVPMLTTVFSTVPLNTTQLLYSFGMACAVPLLSSIFKVKK
ncbi:MAG: cation-transporting P-type ATPase, partial [Clostridiales bacterium]|nr:cation-transporting P-type ATPase [Clostridiales bacterium]